MIKLTVLYNAFGRCSPTLSVRRAPMPSVYKQTGKIMKKFSYKITMIHDLKPKDYPKRYDLSIRCVPYGSVGRLTGKTWDSWVLKDLISFAFWTNTTRKWLCRVAFFMIASSNHSSSTRLQSSVYLDMLEKCALPHLLQMQEKLEFEITFQQCAPPHWVNDVRLAKPNLPKQVASWWVVMD
jgi:hypothetical protein